MEIKDVIEEKRKLEIFILYELKKFENRTGVTIDSVELHKQETLSSYKKIAAVEIFCSI